MDNLDLCYSYDFKIEVDTNETSIKACSHVGGSIICCICENNTLYVHDTLDQNLKFIHHVSNFKKSLKYIQHLPVYNAIFIASETELAIFDIASKQIKCQHTLKSEILGLQWDCTQSVLVLVDALNVLHLYSYVDLTMDSLLANKNQVNLMSNVPGSVMVGWGSQNTQFQGPKQRKQQLVEDSDKAPEHIFDGPPTISWRGSGEQFVVNFFKDGCRYIKVFDNQLNPLFESDKYCNLTDGVSFMGQGQYIACCFVEKNANTLVLFEKNCKLKASTELKETHGSVLKILFNPQINMLGILSTDKDLNNYVDIYLYSNAHWFLKQQLFYPSTLKVHDFFWVETGATLYTTCKLVIFTSEKVEYHYFKFVINKSPGKAIAAVIDGKQLNLYSFENSIIPPPMCSYVFEHQRPISRVIFHPEKLLCVLIDSHFELNVISLEDNSFGAIVLSKDLKIMKNLSFLKIQWIANDLNIFVECDNLIGIITEQKTNDVNLKIIGTNTELENLFDAEYIRLNEPPNISSILLYKAKYELKTNEYQIKLNACRELYIDSRIICSGVTSSVLYKNYLLWTTSTGMLYCLRDDNFSKPSDLANIFSRPVEQGARIVCCNNMTPPQIILQLPRGNLETMSCKMITIDIIDSMLSSNKWKYVLQLMRSEKINWNVLIDLNSKRFYDGIENFISAARFCNLLTSIVTDFDLERNCFETVYKNYFELASNAIEVKKRDIVERILDFLCSKNCVQNLSCIVAIQQKHISLKSALISVKQVYQANADKNDMICNKIIKQILQQAHLKDVLNVAFTLFDLQLLALIYRNSNEDPKVYGPELMNLHNMGEIERRFRLHLKAYNYTGAVKYLLLCDQFDDDYITSFIVKNKLEHVAYCNIRTYKNTSPDQLKLITRHYAKRLTLEGKYVEAGFVLKRAGLFEESLIQYRRALEWREVIALLNQLEYDDERKLPVLESLASELLAKTHIEDALILYQYHIKDYKKVVQSLVEFKFFHRALNTAQIYGEIESLNKVVIPSLLDYTQTLTEKIDTLQSRFQHYTNRLQKVREIRQKTLENDQDDGNFYHSGDDELFSESSSISSGRSSKKTSSSRRSTLSSRNRRKEEKKKVDLREGGFYEDIALMRVLHIMYDEVYEVTKDVRDICLIEELQNDGFCREVHRKLSNLQAEMKEKRTAIWPEEFYKTSLANDATVRALIQNKNDLDPKFVIPPSDNLLNDSWRVGIFT